MMAKRITLAALLLALFTPACTDDAGSGPAGPDARVARRQPVPRRTTVDETPVDFRTVVIEGVRFDFQRIRRDGAVIQTRILRNGVDYLTGGSDIATWDGSTIPLLGYEDGELVFDDAVSLHDATLGSARSGPRRAMVMEFPCEAEMGAFWAAAALFSYELYRLKRFPGPRQFSRTAAAAGLLYQAGRTLWNCIEAADRQVQTL